MDNLLNNPTVLGLLFFVILSLFKLIEYLIKKVFNTNNKALSGDEYDMLKCLYDQHSKCDLDGVPVWYFPRSLVDTQEEIVEAMSKISAQQEKITYILEHLTRQLDKIEQRHDVVIKNSQAS